MEYLKITEFAKLIGVTSTTLRTWEERGILKPHHRSPTGYRYYTRSQADDYFNGRLPCKE